MGVSWVGPVLGEHVHSRSGLGAGALSTWGPLFCLFHCLEAAGFEFLLLFLSPGILTARVRGCLQPVLSTHTAKRQDWVSCVDFYPLLQGFPTVLHPEMPRDVHPPSEIVLKPQDQRIPKPEDHKVTWGEGGQPGELCPSQSPCCGVEKGTGGTQGSAGCDSTALQQGWPGVSHRVAVAQPVVGRACALQELLPPPPGALEILLFSRAVFGTVCVPLLGWSPTRQVIP